MMPRGPPTPLNGAPQVPPSLLRSNSNLLGNQAGEIPPQNMFPSLVSPRNQFTNSNMSMLGNVPNVSSLLHQPFGNGGGTDSDMGFNPPSSSYNSNTPGQGQGQNQGQFSANQMMSDQQQSQHLDMQNFQRSQQFQGMARPNVGPVKLEQQANGGEQAVRNPGPVKLEPQQLQSLRSHGGIKMEPQDSSLFLQQQQQQQLLLSRQSSQAAHLLQQQRLMQQMQQQQQQLLKAAMPQQRPNSVQSQFHPQNMPVRSPSSKPVYEPGMCARRLTHYMYQQQHRPEDNNIEFWRKFVAEYFAPNAKKKWCISMYGSGRQNTGVLPQDIWHCEICNRKPGRGFEATVEVLPRLFKIKYESGTLEELLYVDMPREYQNSSGQIVLDYAKAIQESVFEELRVVRDGQLRIVFSPDLKICSWEFCARRHEELIPRRLLIPQVSQLGAAAQKCQTAAQNSSSNNSSNSNPVSELQNNCNMFLASARQLAKALEVPLVNDLGYTKRFVRCLQISEVVNSMKDLIDYSRESGIGPMESLTKFPRRTNPSPGFQTHPQRPEGPAQQQHQQQTTGPTSISKGNPPTNGMPNPNNNSNTIISAPPMTSSSSPTIAGLLHQNSMNSRQHQQNQNSTSNSSNSPYAGGNNNSIPQMQSTPPFQSPTTPSSSNTAQQQITAHGNNNSSALQGAQPTNQQQMSNEDANDSQSSVQKIIKNMMISSQVGNNAGAGISSGAHVLLGNNNKGFSSTNGGNNGHSGMEFVNGFGQHGLNNGFRGSNTMGVNGRVAMMMPNNQQLQQQHDLGNQMLGGLGAVNGFNDLQFDWKPSP